MWYGLTLGFFALGLLSKPMLVTWPFVLLLLDYWPLGRVTGDGWRVTGGGEAERAKPLATFNWQLSTWKPLVVEKLPFFVITAIFCGLTMLTQSKGMMNPEFLPLHRRIANALVAYADYLQQMVWPTHMTIFYPHPMEQPLGKVALSASGLAIITILVIRAYRRGAYGVTGWCWYLGMLVPVVGLVQVGLQARADRYTYLPSIGIFLMICWAVPALWGTARSVRIVLRAVSAAIVSILILVTQAQVKHWRTSETLFTHAIAVTQNNYVGYGGLAIVQIGRGEVSQAITNLQRALEAAKVYDVESTVKFYMGVALQLQGKGLEALPYLEGADTVADHVPDRNYRLGLSYIEAGRLNEAEDVLARALAIRPGNADYRLGLAALRYQQGRAAEAEEIYKHVITDNPEHAQAHRSYADFLLLQNRVAEAEGHYAKAAALQPPDVLLRRSYATVLSRLGKLKEAGQQLAAAHQRDPENPGLNFDYAELLAQTGNLSRAIELYEQALRADPKLISALNNLAWILATNPKAEIRNGARAVELAQRACELTGWRSAFLMGTLAAAYAEAGRFPEAVAMAEKARDRAREDKLDEVARRNEELRQLYASGKPYRDGQ